MSENKIPTVYALDAGALQVIVNTLGEVPSKLGYPAMKILEAVQSKPLPESLVQMLMAPPEKSTEEEPPAKPTRRRRKAAVKPKEEEAPVKEDFPKQEEAPSESLFDKEEEEEGTPAVTKKKGKGSKGAK